MRNLRSAETVVLPAMNDVNVCSLSDLTLMITYLQGGLHVDSESHLLVKSLFLGFFTKFSTWTNMWVNFWKLTLFFWMNTEHKYNFNWNTVYIFLKSYRYSYHESGELPTTDIILFNNSKEVITIMQWYLHFIFLLDL